MVFSHGCDRVRGGDNAGSELVLGAWVLSRSWERMEQPGELSPSYVGGVWVSAISTSGTDSSVYPAYRAFLLLQSLNKLKSWWQLASVST